MARHTIELELDDRVLRDWADPRGTAGHDWPVELRVLAEGALHRCGLAVVRWRAAGRGETGEEDGDGDGG